MSHIENLSRVFKAGGHVMGETASAGSGLAAYHAAKAVRDAARVRNPSLMVAAAQRAARNWRVRVSAAQSPHRLLVETQDKSDSYRF